MGKSTSAEILRAPGACRWWTRMNSPGGSSSPASPPSLKSRMSSAGKSSPPMDACAGMSWPGLSLPIRPRAEKLEAILHPRIRAAWLAQLETWRRENHPLAVVVIPLLFETRAESRFDKIVCVACSAAAQHERLRARGWNAEQIRQRLAAQWAGRAENRTRRFRGLDGRHVGGSRVAMGPNPEKM